MNDRKEQISLWRRIKRKIWRILFKPQRADAALAVILILLLTLLLGAATLAYALR